jgi:DNA-binding CsgD family transcriptional regulator
MPDSPDQNPEGLLRSTVFSLEAEYRVPRSRTISCQGGTGISTCPQFSPGWQKRPEHGVATDGGSQAAQPAPVALTTRETQILTLIAAGNSTKQAAFILGIRFKTAAGHRSQLMKKLDIHDTASLVRFAIRSGLVEP